MNADKWLWLIFDYKGGQSVSIGMKFELDVWHHLLNAYTKFQIDISNHVEKSLENADITTAYYLSFTIGRIKT